MKCTVSMELTEDKCVYKPAQDHMDLQPTDSQSHGRGLGKNHSISQENLQGPSTRATC